MTDSEVGDLDEAMDQVVDMGDPQSELWRSSLESADQEAHTPHAARPTS